MTILDIVTHPDDRLRTKCSPVEEITDEIRTLLDDMAQTMYRAPGIGLAGPQVASNLRLIVVDVGDEPEQGRKGRLYQIVNPQIVDKDGSTSYEEGCLSIPEIRETVKRPESVRVEGWDKNGSPVAIEADGLLSICLQHEIDHLDGVLFIDRVSKLKQQLIKSRYKKILQQIEDEQNEYEP